MPDAAYEHAERLDGRPSDADNGPDAPDDSWRRHGAVEQVVPQQPAQLDLQPSHSGRENYAHPAMLPIELEYTPGMRARGARAPYEPRPVSRLDETAEKSGAGSEDHLSGEPFLEALAPAAAPPSLAQPPPRALHTTGTAAAAAVRETHTHLQPVRRGRRAERRGQ